MQEVPPILDEQLADSQAGVEDRKHPVVVDVPATNLKFASYNPRSISQKEFEDLQRSIDEFGFVEPVVVNQRNMVIVGGHMRVRAAKEMGYVTVPVVYVNLSETKERALNVALNKISGQWDDQLLVELLDSLDEDSLLLTGFSDEELQALSADPFDAPEPPKEDGPKEVKYTVEALRYMARSNWPNQFETINQFLDWLDDRQKS